VPESGGEGIESREGKGGQASKGRHARQVGQSRTKEQKNKRTAAAVATHFITSGVSGLLSHNNTVADQTKKYIFSNEIHREQGREASKVGKQGRQARQSRTKEKRENT
jgi:hypothetical protein